tara:strand:+ start:1422 stop:2294 length:873 start_codon:yes stop_codon:yes gene_type:complete
MQKIEFVDAHVHYYDMKHPDLFYAHWQPGVPHPVLGPQIQKLAERSYFAEDYIADTRSSNVIQAVHVQAAIGSKDPVKETEWLQESFERTGFPNAIVAHADLKYSNVEDVLERHCSFENMKGVRDFSNGDYLVDPSFKEGFSLLEKFDLVSSIAAEWHEMAKVVSLANEFPNIQIVLDHAGLPMERTKEYFEFWRQGILTASKAENIYIKISGLGMGDNNWSVDSIRPYVLHCIDSFGPSRVIFATNWPIDSLWSSYENVVDSYLDIIQDFSSDEKVAMFSANTRNLYSI